MNRRSFLQSLAAALSLPAMPALSLPTAAAPAMAAVPANARFWAIYMSALHGECTPQALQNMLKIPAGEAQNYIAQLIADGAIKPNPLLRKAAVEAIKPKEDNFWNKLKERLDMKTRGEAAEEVETLEEVEEMEDLEEMDAAEAVDALEVGDEGESIDPGAGCGV